MANEVDVGHIKPRVAFLYDMINELDFNALDVSNRVDAILVMISRLGGLGAWQLDDRADYRVVCALDEAALLDDDRVKALHGATGKTVLLKKWFSVRNALREACFLAACRGHPSLVGLHSVARDLPEAGVGPYYVATEHVGPSLYEIMEEERCGKPYSEAEVRRIMLQLLGGAAAMQERGVVHGFINDMTVFLAGDGAFKIGEFWRARPTQARTAHTDARELEEDAGWVADPAPEFLVAAGERPFRAPMDAWSLGCLMTSLLRGGEDLFHGEYDVGAAKLLSQMFNILGPPGDEAWEELEPLMPEKARRTRARLMREGRGSQLRRIIPRKKLSDDGFDVLRGLLEYSPSERLTPAAALRLPWFKERFATAAALRLKRLTTAAALRLPKRLRFPRFDATLAAVSTASDEAKLLVCMLLCVLASFYFYFFNT